MTIGSVEPGLQTTQQSVTPKNMEQVYEIFQPTPLDKASKKTKEIFHNFREAVEKKNVGQVKKFLTQDPNLPLYVNLEHPSSVLGELRNPSTDIHNNKARVDCIKAIFDACPKVVRMTFDRKDTERSTPSWYRVNIFFDSVLFFGDLKSTIFLVDKFPDLARAKHNGENPLQANIFRFRGLSLTNCASLPCFEYFLNAFPEAALSLDDEKNNILHLVANTKEANLADLIIKKFPKLILQRNKENLTPFQVAQKIFGYSNAGWEMSKVLSDSLPKTENQEK